MCNSYNNQHETQQKRKAAMTLTKEPVTRLFFIGYFLSSSSFKKIFWPKNRKTGRWHDNSFPAYEM